MGLEGLVILMIDKTGGRTRVSKGTAKAVAVVLLLVAAGFVVAGVAAAGQNELLPMALGRLAGQERSLSRDTVTLAIHVGSFNANGDPQRAVGAVVTVTSLRSSLAATQTTDERGRVVFELRRGAYVGAVDVDGMTLSAEFVLRDDTRAVVVFDEDGQGHVFRHDRQTLARHGEWVTLYVAVRQADANGTQAPVEDAVVRLARVHASDSGTRLEPVGGAETGPRGVAVVRVEPGQYAFEVVTPENHSAVGRQVVRTDQAVGVFFDADGQAHVRSRDAPTARGDANHVAVHVETEDGRAVADAHVRIVATTDAGDEVVARGVTGPHGNVVLTVPDGSYRIAVDAGDRTGSTRIDVSGDTRARVVVSPS